MSEYTKRYNPSRHADWNYKGSKWKLSRSKIDAFHECPRCFYVDNVLGIKRPSFPPFNLNNAVDELCKREFDHYRKLKSPHPLMTEYRIDAVPFAHDDLDTWRDPFVGITHLDTETNLLVSGGVDDIWQSPDGTLIIVDYKATAKDGRIETLGDSPWEQQYTRQLGIYRWLLEQNGFKVAETGYLVYANADKTADTFADTLLFETTLVPVITDVSWIPNTLTRIKACLESTTIPPSGEACEFCPYREAVGKRLLAIHQQTKASAT
jgi:CRISPR/Cas system-associated exonuclease Cas4 (RecB family)